MNIKNILVTVVIAALVAVIAVAVVGGNNQPQATKINLDDFLGASGTRFPHGITVGTSTPMTKFLFGSCVPDDYNVTQIASSTKAYSCPVAGVNSGDFTFVQIATSTAPGSGNATIQPQLWSVVGSAASSTDGYITFLYRNDGPGNRPSNAGVASSTYYIVIDN